MSEPTIHNIHEAVEEFSAAVTVCYNEFDQPEENLTMQVDHEDGIIILSRENSDENPVTIDVASEYPLIYVSYNQQSDEFTEVKSAATFALSRLFS